MSDERQDNNRQDPNTPPAEGKDHASRPVSDDSLREEMSRETVEACREDGDKAHANRFAVMWHPYGND